MNLRINEEEASVRSVCVCVCLCEVEGVTGTVGSIEGMKGFPIPRDILIRLSISRVISCLWFVSLLHPCTALYPLQALH